MAAPEELSAEELEELYPHVLRTARAIVGPDAAEDVAQETFLRLLAAAPVRSWRAWLTKVARNLSIDELRRTSRLTPVDRVPETEHPAPDIEELMAVRGAVRKLPERYRLVLWLKHVEGRSASEIAELLGTTTTAVEMTLFRARTKLRTSYGAAAQSALAVLLALPLAARRLLSSLVRTAAPAMKPAATLLAAAAVGGGLVVASPTPVAVAPEKEIRVQAAPQAVEGPPDAAPHGRVSRSEATVAVPAPPLELPVLEIVTDALDRLLETADTVAIGKVQYRHGLRDVYHRVQVGEVMTGTLERRWVDVQLERGRKLPLGGTVVLALGPDVEGPVVEPLDVFTVERKGGLLRLDGSELGFTLDDLRARIEASRDDASSGEPSGVETSGEKG